MARPTSYAELITTVAGYINKRNLDAEIDGFIGGAESDLNARLRDRRMIATREATTVCGSIELPTGWLEARRVRIVGAGRPLAFATLDEALTLAEAGGDTGHYTIRGTVLDLVPTPAADAVVELVYYDALPALSATQASNWLLAQEPLLYVYGACLHAAPYLMDDERVPAWSAYFTARIEMLNAATGISQFSGAPLVRRRRGFG